MPLEVRSRLRARGLAEPIRSHAAALTRRVSASLGLESKVDDAAAWAAGLEYLAARVERPELEVHHIADLHGVPAWRVMRILGVLRDTSEYRAYVGAWIRDGCPTFVDELDSEPAGPASEFGGPEAADREDGPWLVDSLIGLEQEALGEEEDDDTASPPALLVPPPGVELNSASTGVAPPSRWQASFRPYEWQEQAALAWEQNEGRGIMQVVTGAGKTALAIYLYGRLLDRLDALGHELQVIVVVPRVELVRQWTRELRRLLDLRRLRLGQYHGKQKCSPDRQDILIITQDSARRVVPRMRFDRPVLLVADECHRLGAPGASRLLARDFSWTLGLSATPERSGDFGFEQILVPRLGPVVWKYGYREAVQDGIIAHFAVARVKVDFTPEEARDYADRSEQITCLLDALKKAYPALRRVGAAQFWQVMGELKRREPDDARFEMLTAAANERRSIVHFAEEKYRAVAQLAHEVGHPRKVLCFHERVEAADRLGALCHEAGRAPAIYHYKVSQEVREANLERFRSGKADWLITCKSLDEGIDIPAVDTVVIVAGTRAPRQLIQRLGRALRRKDQNGTAAVVLIEVAGVDDTALDHEALDELTEAAEEVVELPLSGLAAWLHGGDNGRSGAAPLLDEGDADDREVATPKRVPAKKERRLIDQVRSWGSGIARRMSWGGWTGTGGNQSYYDKDSSPD